MINVFSSFQRLWLFFYCGLREKNLLKRNVPLIYLYEFFRRMDFAVPVLILYFEELTGSYMRGMSIFSIAYLTGAFLGIPLGVLSDKIGRKRVAMLCSFCRFLSYFFYAVAGNYFFLVVGGILAGFNRFSAPNIDTLLYETSEALGEKDVYHEALSKAKSIGAFALAVGACMCAVLCFLFSLHAVVIFACFAPFCSFLVSLKLKEAFLTRAVRENPFKHFMSALRLFLKNKKLSLFAIADALFFGFNEAAFTLNSAFFKTLIPVEFLGVLRFVGHMMTSFTSYFSGLIGRKIGVNKTLFFGACCDNLLNITSVLLAQPVLTPFLKTCASGSFGIYSPASGTFMQNEVEGQERATQVALVSVTNSLFFAIGCQFVGFCADLFGPAHAMLLGYSVSLASNSLYLIAFKLKGKERS